MQECDVPPEIMVSSRMEHAEPVEEALHGGLGELGREVAGRVRLESDGPDGTGG